MYNTNMTYLYILHNFNHASQKWCVISSEDAYGVMALFNTFPVNDAFDLFITSKVNSDYFEIESEIGETYILQRFEIAKDNIIDLEVV